MIISKLFPVSKFINIHTGSDRIKVPSVGLGRDSEGRALFDFLPYNDESGLLKVAFIIFYGINFVN